MLAHEYLKFQLFLSLFDAFLGEEPDLFEVGLEPTELTLEPVP
jgi:hypothetical protein